MKFNFSLPKNTMVITTKDIIQNEKDILVVSHDAEDGMWQFLDGEDITEENAAVVSLFEIFQIDNSVSELSGMPIGCVAYRKQKNDKWVLVSNDSENLKQSR